MASHAFKLTLSLVLLAHIFSCKTRGSAGEVSNVKDLFENARRRPAEAQDSKSLVRIYSVGDDVLQCSGYYVKNQSNKTLVMTARHCANFDEYAWCAAGGKVRAVTGSEGVGRCKSILATDAQGDMFLFDTDLVPPAGAVPVTLAGYYPSTGTRLKMVGFPADVNFAANRQQNDFVPYVTENCWIREGSVPAAALPNEEGHHDEQFFHNCATYGGNSGGPMFVEGTTEVVAQPARYTYGQTEPMPFDTDDQSRAHIVARFVAVNASKLNAAKVAIQGQQFSKGRPGDYIAVGLYLSSDLPSCPIYFFPQYQSARRLADGWLEFKGSAPCAGWRKLDCGSTACTNEGFVLQDLTTNSFVYFNASSGTKATFVLKLAQPPSLPSANASIGAEGP